MSKLRSHEKSDQNLNFFAKWAKFFIEKYKITIIFLITLGVLGIWGTYNNQRQDFPSITINYAFISAVYPGASPETIANEAIKPIERAIKDQPEIKSIRSSASPNFGMIIVELNTFDKEKIEKLNSDFSNIIDGLTLPEEVETQVSSESSAAGPSLVYVLSSDTLPFNDILDQAPRVKDYLEQASDEIKEVQLMPDADFEVRVVFDADKLKSRSLNVVTVKQIITSYLSVLPGGSVKDTGSKTKKQITIQNPTSSLEDIKNIPLPTGGVITDIADVFRQPSTEDVIAMAGFLKDEKGTYDDETIYLMFIKQDDGDIINMKKDVDVALDKIYDEDVISDAYNIDLVLDSSKEVQLEIDSLLRNGIIGLIAIILVFMFFIDIRIGIVVGIIIPFAFLATLFVLNQIGFTLNVLTLFAMILTLGILVDNAIVIAEGVVHRMNKYKESKAQAAIGAIHDLGPAVTSATATTIVVFIPAANMGGIMGEFMKYIPLTIIVMMFVSYFLAISITPLLSRWILKQETENERSKRQVSGWRKILILPYLVLMGQRFLNNVVKLYGKIMKDIYKSKFKKILVIAITILMLAGSLGIAASGKIPGSQFPITDSPRFAISTEFPPGTPFETQKDIMTDLFKESSQVPYFEGAYLYENINVIITEPTKRSKDKKTTVFTIVEDLDKKIQYIRDKAPQGSHITVDAQSYGPPSSGYDVILEVKDEDPVILKKAIEDIDAFVRAKGETDDYTIERISNELSDELVPSVDITFKKDKLKEYGISPLTTSLIVNSVFSKSEIGKVSIRKDGVQDNIVLLFNNGSKGSIDKLKEMMIPTAAASAQPSAPGSPTAPALVRLDDIADVSLIDKAQSIHFIDSERSVSYSIDLDIPKDNKSGAVQKFETELKDYLSPEKLDELGLGKESIGYGGFASEFQTDMSKLQFVFLIAILAVYLILVFQFGSYIQPVLILFAIPLAFIGVFPGLLLTKSSIDMISGLGIIALVGIVVNDAIVFVDYFNRQVKKHPEQSLAETLVYTGKVRFKPIFSTSVTTIAGILPLAIREPFWTGLGTAVVAGLIFSTAGNLIVLPILLYGVRKVHVYAKKVKNQMRCRFCKQDDVQNKTS